LETKKNLVRATAVVANVSIQTGGDAIQVAMEHEDSIPVSVILPYSKRRFRNSLDFGELRAEAGTRRIWI